MTDTTSARPRKAGEDPFVLANPEIIINVPMLMMWLGIGGDEEDAAARIGENVIAVARALFLQEDLPEAFPYRFMGIRQEGE